MNVLKLRKERFSKSYFDIKNQSEFVILKYQIIRHLL